MSTSSVTATATPSANGTQLNSPSSTNGLNENAFLQLLTSEIQNQDPLDPVDDTQFISELAQFSSLQQESSINSGLTSFESGSSVVQAATMIGHTVTATSSDSSTPITGTVNSVTVNQGQVTLDIDGNQVPVSNVTSVS